MENASEALILAFAVIVFVIALTVSINSFNSVKAVADTILYSKDETNYYDYQGAIGKAQENRIVGLETIIPTLYKYYKENYTVVFKLGNYDEETGEFTNWNYLTVYNTSSNSSLWGYNGEEDSNGNTSYDKLMKAKYGESLERSTSIFSFDLDEETLRHEPWTGSNSELKKNIDCFLQGSTYENPTNNITYINYSLSPLSTGGFIGKYKNKKFVETISEYTYETTQTSENGLVKEKTKRIITFTLIK
jgi:hypothetical protein